MPILMTCPCSQNLQARDTDAGQQVRCPACLNVLVVPASQLVQPPPSLAPVTALPPQLPCLPSDQEACRPDDSWYLARKRQRTGPFSAEQLREIASDGRICPTDMLLKRGDTKWVAASSLPWLFPSCFGVIASPSPPPAGPSRLVLEQAKPPRLGGLEF
jgi:hypothetical protein